MTPLTLPSAGQFAVFYRGDECLGSDSSDPPLCPAIRRVLPRERVSGMAPLTLPSVGQFAVFYRGDEQCLEIHFSQSVVNVQRTSISLNDVDIQDTPKYRK